jgi:CheY-like chemotaxis protein
MSTILVSGVDEAAVQALTRALEADGHKVILASNGPEAYALVLSEKPAFVFLEDALAVFSGLDTSAMLRADPDIPDNLPIFIFGTVEPSRKALDQAGVTRFLAQHKLTVDLPELLGNLGGNAPSW